MKEEEIQRLFRELNLTTEKRRKQILSQGIVQAKEENKPSLWVDADNVTVEEGEKCA